MIIIIIMLLLRLLLHTDTRHYHHHDHRNISAVPIVDEEGRVIDLYHRFDVTFIALAGDAEQTMSNLNMCLSDLLPQRRGR